MSVLKILAVDRENASPSDTAAVSQVALTRATAAVSIARSSL